VSQLRQPDALAAVIGAVEAAVPRGGPAILLRLASHVALRTEPWPHRVFLPRGSTRAWGTPDSRAPLRGDAVGAIVALARAELVARAAARRNFARAVIDRVLVDRLVPLGERRVVAMLASTSDDIAELRDAYSHGRPTLWDIAAIHAAARANIVYVRERSGAIAVYRRRDTEQTLARLARLHAGDDPDGMIDELPAANAPTWFALARDDVALPAGSTGYVFGPRTAEQSIERLSAVDLLGDLVR
jgi:hypothetical protein